VVAFVPARGRGQPIATADPLSFEARYMDLWLLNHDVMYRSQSRESVCKAGRAGSVIELGRIEGTIFKTSKEQEPHGLELARRGVDRKKRLEE
jgi:hypothetical protein